jgi:transcriptional regulator with GAF, ATPase, and Fis domain
VRIDADRVVLCAGAIASAQLLMLSGIGPAADLAALRRFGTHSTVAVPLSAHGTVFGCLTFATTRRARAWPGELVTRFELIAQIFATALARRQTEDQLRSALDDLQRLKDRLHHENVYLRDEIRERRNPAQSVGTSAALRRTLDLVGQVAPTASTVLLLGETGTGKERVAAAIHELSPRRSRPMVKVNCAAIPGTLTESELFGRERGAYTGALTRQTGRFDLADGSTIFLDEIGDLPLETQIKLLRVIETREFERLGSPNPIHVDARIIAATNKNLDQAVRDGRFREDLFFRLNVFPIRLPALRERPLYHYTLACYEAQLGDLDEARRRLGRAIELRPDLAERATTDPDLAPLRLRVC